MTQSPNLPPAGWYPDPAGGGGERFWDGTAWSQSTRDPRQAAPMPYAAPQGMGAPMQQPGPYRGSQPMPMRPVAMVQALGGKPLASFWLRAVGYLIDYMLLYVTTWLLRSLFAREANMLFDSYLRAFTEALVLGDPLPPTPVGALATIFLVGFVAVALYAAYRTLMLRHWGQTLGQMAMGLKAVREGDHSLGQLTWREALLRGALGAFVYYLIGIFAQLPAAFLTRRQTVADLFAKTVVVNLRGVTQ